MAIDCTPSELADQAKCFNCLSQEQKESIKTYLLAVIAGLDGNTPQQLAALAKCYTCLPSESQKAIQSYLLCQAANGGSGPAECLNLEGAGDPTGAETPDFIGQTYRDTDTNNIYTSTGLTNADWSLTVQDFLMRWTPTSVDLNSILPITNYFTDFTDPSGNPVAITEIRNLVTESLFGIDIEWSTLLGKISYPNLVNIDINNDGGGYVYLEGNDALTEVSFPLLEYVSSQFVITGNTSLTSVNIAKTKNIPVNINTNPALTTIDFSSAVPVNFQNLRFNNNALTASCVNSILERCVASAAFVSGQLRTDGGTNAAPSGQGILDKATLIGRGVTVTTN